MTSSKDSRSILGSLRSEHGKGVVRVEDTYDTNIEDLWNALTEPRRLERWIADVRGDLTLGGHITARFTSTWEGTGRIDVCDPPNRLLVSMRPGEHDQTVVEAWLSSQGDRTQLIIEERGLPLADTAAHGAGWQIHLEDLGVHVADRDPAGWHDRWTELRPAYERLAIEAVGSA